MSNFVVIANGLVKIGITSLLVLEKCGYFSGHAQIKCFFFYFSDILLCRDYAEAKECVTQQAKTGCAIGQYINRDLFNPFCTYNTDPPLNSSGTALNCLCFLAVTTCK